MSWSLALRKLGTALVTLAFVIVFNFFLFRVVNDDPTASMFRGRNLSPSQIETLRQQFNLDGSQWEQFVAYVRELFSGNLGISLVSRRAVTTEIADAFWPTVALVGISTLVSTVVGVLLGIYAGWRRGSAFDVGATSFSMFTYAMPDFFLGMVLLGFLGVKLGLFPTGGITDAGSTATGVSLLVDQAHHIVLPALTLALAYLGEYVIVMRSSLLDTVREDYLKLARAKGLRDADVRRLHAVPNALLPVVSLIALNFGYVLSGAIAVEAIFSWPGLGQASFEALNAPDLPMLQGLFLLFSAAVIVANLITDLLYPVLDPRVRPS